MIRKSMSGRGLGGWGCAGEAGGERRCLFFILFYLFPFASKASTQGALTELGLEGRSCGAPPAHPSSLSPRVCPEEPQSRAPFCLCSQAINIQTRLQTRPRVSNPRGLSHPRPGAAWSNLGAPQRLEGGCESGTTSPTPCAHSCTLEDFWLPREIQKIRVH